MTGWEDERRVPEGVPLADVFLFGSVEVELFEKGALSGGDAAAAGGDLEIGRNVGGEDGPGGFGGGASGELLDNGVVVCNGETSAEFLGGFALPGEFEGIGAGHSSKAWCGMVGIKGAME